MKLKAIAHTGDPKLLAEAIRSYARVKDLNTKTYALKGSEMFGSTKRKLNLPPGSKYDSHCPDKVTYFIPALTKDPLGHILKSPSHMMRMWCFTPLACWSPSVQDTYGTFLPCLIRQRKSAKHCRSTHGIHVRLKWGRINMAHPHQLTKV